MNSLPGYDAWKLASQDDDAPTEVDATETLDEMVSEPDCFDNWLSMSVVPSSVDSLLSLLLDRGLPRMDESVRDDELRDAYDALLTRVREDFDSWAQHSAKGKDSPVDQWIADGPRF